MHRVPTGLQEDPGSDKTEGFRYFMPKPYLLITNIAVLPAPVTPRTEPYRDEARSGTDQSNPPITVQVIWLPDTRQQYAVSIEGGRTGTFKGALQLSNGWMLVAVNEEFDTKAAETLNALSGALATILKTPGVATRGFAGAESKKPFLYLFEIDMQNRQLVPVKSDELEKALRF